MSPTPVMPAIGVSPGNSAYYWTRMRPQYHTNVYALVRGYWDRLTIYDSRGQAWSVSNVIPTRPLSMLDRWLARTVYNPKLAVRLELGPPRAFELKELKAQLVNLVQQDDDVLTQELDPADLLLLIERAGSFVELADSLRRHGVLADHDA